MADVNYVNPGALDPGVGFKPDGFLGGMEWQRRNQMFQDAQSLQDLMSRNSAIESNIKTREFQQDAPIRSAKGLADLATANATAATIGRTKEAELQNLYATGRMHNATAGAQEQKNDEFAQTSTSRVAAEIAKHAAEGGKAGLDSLQQSIKATQGALQILSTSGPAGLAGAMSALRQAGVPPEQLQIIANSPNPAKSLAALNKALLEADNHYQTNMGVAKEHSASAANVANINAASQLAVANARTAAKSKSAIDILRSVKTPEEAALKAQMIYSDPDVDMKTKMLAQETFRQAQEQIKNKNAVKVGPQVTPGGIVPPAVTYGGLNGQPQQTAPKDPSGMSDEELLKALNGG